MNKQHVFYLVQNWTEFNLCPFTTAWRKKLVDENGKYYILELYLGEGASVVIPEINAIICTNGDFDIQTYSVRVFSEDINLEDVDLYAPETEFSQIFKEFYDGHEDRSIKTGPIFKELRDEFVQLNAELGINNNIFSARNKKAGKKGETE